ncbi:proline-rich protein 3 isoform X3 [Rattus rattus]|uniref:proline-rich protein 3 isoform X3 n=1 Tax=Rattus rattus TaxID=10117 RepID=UPI0013F2D685|nr:proline-rich protein 3 isoform X3 [Rattus rattus]
MPKRKKQNQPQPPQHLALSERDEPGDEEDERPMGPPSLLGPPPMANGKPGDPKSGHGGPSREIFYQEPRNPRRLKSWSLVKNTYQPKDSPQMMEDKSDRPVCRHFSKKGHCRYEDHCAFYHPGVNGPPL